MHAPTADAAESNSPLSQPPDPAPDQIAERAVWALALAAWMHAPEPDALALPAPDPTPAPPDPIPAEWWTIVPHASDWWM